MTVERTVPRLRGVSHLYALYAAIPAGLALVALAPSGPSTLAACIYALALFALLSISAMYHRGNWSKRGARRMRLLDHATIFVFIAASFTPFAMLVVNPSVGTPALAAMWGTVALGVGFKLVWLDAPPWLASSLYVAAGCVVLPCAGEVLAAIGPTGAALMVTGAVSYVLGAAVYATHWPDPSPLVFGYHEVFHLFVLLGVAMHYLAIAVYAVQAI